MGEADAALRLTKVESIDGHANIAVIRGEPRMGYELSLKLEFGGVDETFFQDFNCSVDIEELCDDGGEPESVKVNMIKMLDTT